MEKGEARKLVEELIAKHGLIFAGWRFAFNKTRKTWGRCWYNVKVIFLSIYFIKYNDEEVVRKTILHEIAHALVGKDKGHGAEWKRVCTEIGGDPRAYTKPGEVNMGWASYQSSCLCGALHSKYRKPSKRRTYRCPVCKQILDYKKMRKGVFLQKRIG